MRTHSLIVLLTDYCNQNCEFCFAQKEMARATRREITFKDFQLIIKKMEENSLLGLYLYGGEPTLHTQFEKIITYALRYFFAVSLSTNGIFSQKIKDFLLAQKRRVNLMFNICTPGFIRNPGIRKLVLNNINDLSKQTCITLGLNDSFLGDNLYWIVDLFPREVLKRLEICMGVTRPYAGGKDFIKFEDFPKTGRHIVNLMKYFDEKGPPRVVDFIAGTNPCMFTDVERKFIKNHGAKLRYNCHLGYYYDWFMVTPDLTAVRCYPLSTCDRFQIDKNTDFVKLKNKFITIHKKYRKSLILPKCKTCPFYGAGKDKCVGPCISVRMNTLNILPQDFLGYS